MIHGLRFFEPDDKMIAWLRNYIGKRIPVDVGCGYGDLLLELNMGGIGIEPFAEIDLTKKLDMNLDNNIQIITLQVQQCGAILKGLQGKAIMIFARPCHSSFVEEGIALAPTGMEILYITKPSNIEDYCDLGQFDGQKKLIKHEGKGEEDEVVYSIIKK